MALCCPSGQEHALQAALRSAYPNSRLIALHRPMHGPPSLLSPEEGPGVHQTRQGCSTVFEHEREPSVNRLLTAMGAGGEPVLLQIAMTPTPRSVRAPCASPVQDARGRTCRDSGGEHIVVHDRSMVDDVELRGGLEVQHKTAVLCRQSAWQRPIAAHVSWSPPSCVPMAPRIASSSGARRFATALFSLYRRRLQRGEGNPLPAWHRGVFASTEAGVALAPAVDRLHDSAIRPQARRHLRRRHLRSCARATATERFRDSLGAVSIHPQLRKQNTAVPGSVEQGKSSYLIATVAEDLRRDRCAVIVLDPKGDAADAAVSLVPSQRTCTLLDFAHPTCGF